MTIGMRQGINQQCSPDAIQNDVVASTKPNPFLFFQSYQTEPAIQVTRQCKWLPDVLVDDLV